MPPAEVDVLDQLFFPKSLLVIGVSPKADNLGRNIVANLMEFRFKGELHLMGRDPGVLIGHRIKTSWDEIPQGIDMALIITPAKTIPGMMENCGTKGIRHVVIESAGFKEMGPEGEALGEEVLAIARRHGIRFQGPNCLGMSTFSHGMFTIFVPCPVLWRTGNVAIAAQSGGVGVTYLFDMASENIGVSHFASLGNKLDLDETDFLNALANGEQTGIIAMYLEGVSRGRAFFEALRACDKPVLIQKSGRTSLGSAAAFSHTAALASDDAVLTAAIQQAGALRVIDTDDMITQVKGFLMPPMKGPRVAVISRSGGHAVISADSAAECGFTLPPLPPEFLATFARLHSSSVIRPRNPLDLGDLFNFEVYAELMEEAAAHPDFDAVILAHTYVADSRRHGSRKLVSKAEELAKKYDKPIVVALYSDAVELAELKKLNNYPFFTSVEQGIKALSASHRNVLLKQRRSSNGSWQVPQRVQAAADKVSALAKAGRTSLLSEGFDVLQAAGVSVAPWTMAKEASDLMKVASFPVAAKVISAKAVHKSDAGGVVLGINDGVRLAEVFSDLTERFGPFDTGEGVLLQAMAARGIEMIVGGTRDPVFGPLVVVGLGGVLVEVLKDTSFRLAPVTAFEARDMLSDLRAAKLLDGVRGQPPADIDALVAVIEAVGGLMATCPEIREIDLNPVLVHANGLGATVVDVRIAL
jgi:acetyltransferase